MNGEITGELTVVNEVFGVLSAVPVVSGFIAGFDKVITGELSIANKLSGVLSAMPTITGFITAPNKVIPSNYGLITWNGSVLTVS